MEEAVRFNAAEPASTEDDTQSLSRWEHALELLLTIAEILRRRFTGCWPTIPNACSLAV